MLPIRRSPWYKSNAIEAQQTALRSNPQIPIRGLCNRIRRAAKDSVLHPPGGVSILRDVAGRIDCPDRVHGEEQQQKRKKMPPRNVRPFCFWSRVCTALFEWAHAQSGATTPEEHTCTADAERSPGSTNPGRERWGCALPAVLTLPASRLSRNIETYSYHPAVFYSPWNALRFEASRAAPQWLRHASDRWLPACPRGS